MRYGQRVLDIVTNSVQHFTAEDVFFTLKREYPGVVMATVYNNLNRLCQQGLIKKISIEGQSDRYDRATRHDHLVCSHCGSISDIFLASLEADLEKQCGFQIEGYDLKIRYVCPECRDKISGESEPNGTQ